MKPLTLLGFLIGAVVAGFLYLHFVRDPWVRKTAALEADKVTLDSSLRVLEARDRLRAKIDTVYVRRIIQAKARVDTLTLFAAAAESVYVEALPDTLRPGFRAVMAAKDSIIAGKDLIIGNLEQRLALRDTTITGYQAALAEALRQRDDYRRLAKPSFIVKLLENLPLILGSVGAGVGIGVALSP